MTETVSDDVAQIHASLLTILARRYPMVDREDISQELWLAYYGSDMALDGPEKPVESLEGPDEWETYSKALKDLRREMEASAKRWCRGEKAASEGYELDDEVFYSIGALKPLLEAWFAHGPAEAPAKSHQDSVSRPTRATSYGDYLVSLIDVGAALKRLKSRHKTILWYAYAPAYAGRTDEEIATELRSSGWQGMSVERFTGAHGRALRMLQRNLGGSR